MRSLSQNAPAPTTTVQRQGDAPLKRPRPSTPRCALQMAALPVVASHTTWCVMLRRSYAQTNFSAAIRPGDAFCFSPPTSTLNPKPFSTVISPWLHSIASDAIIIVTTFPRFCCCKNGNDGVRVLHQSVPISHLTPFLTYQLPLIPCHSVNVFPSLQARHLSGCMLAVLQTWEGRIFLPRRCLWRPSPVSV